MSQKHKHLNTRVYNSDGLSAAVLSGIKQVLSEPGGEEKLTKSYEAYLSRKREKIEAGGVRS